MRKPTIHLNGTSGAQLLSQYIEAAHALSKAAEALAEAAPNGRDYYPQGDGAFAEASMQHQARATAVQQVMKDMQELAEHVSDEMDKRERSRP